MKKLISVALLATAIVPAPLSAKPVNAADVQKRDTCLVSDATGLYRLKECSGQIVVKRDRDGNVTGYNYRDSSTLDADQVAPDRAIHRDLSGGDCTGSETVTPSGHYSSQLHCKF